MLGADEVYLLSGRTFAGADTLAITCSLAQGVHRMGGADLILCGEESSDGATGQVPPGLAKWLDMDRGTARGRRVIRGGYELLEVPLPCVVSVKAASNEPRFMDYKIKPWAFEAARVTVWDAADLKVKADHIGLEGSPTIVTELASAAVRERRREMLQGTTQELVRQLMELLKEVH